MWKQIASSIFVLLIITSVTCDIPEKLKKDIFNIYKGFTIQTREIVTKNVTRDQVAFHMYRNTGSPTDAILTTSNLNLLKSTKGKIVFVVHGWTQSATGWVIDLKDAILSTHPDNAVITVDWKDPANEEYFISAYNTNDVGNLIGDMVLELIETHHVDISKFIMIGHSLGGQVMGFAGKRVKSTGRLLPRIIALDPAGPLFILRPVDQKLNPKDAQVVMVLHSNGGTFGVKEIHGTIDIFANGGSFQPGCAIIDLLDLSSLTETVFCSHQRAYLFFVEAVLNPDNFEAKECEEFGVIFKNCDSKDTVNLGDLNIEKSGKYYLETNKEKPYAKKKASGFSKLFKSE